MVFDLKQVHRHLTDPDLRAKALARVADPIGEDTRVVVAHSLGSAITCEALRTRPDHQVRALVTIGSPLGIPNLIPRSDRDSRPSPYDGNENRACCP
jgi:pimeloyl-ACP methyl ester carboxylesterase